MGGTIGSAAGRMEERAQAGESWRGTGGERRGWGHEGSGGRTDGEGGGWDSV